MRIRGRFIAAEIPASGREEPRRMREDPSALGSKRNCEHENQIPVRIFLSVVSVVNYLPYNSFPGHFLPRAVSKVTPAGTFPLVSPEPQACSSLAPAKTSSYRTGHLVAASLLLIDPASSRL